MGAGLALQFKLKYPDTYHYYVGLCKAGKLRLGSPRGYIENGKGIILFPTKYHWRETSRIEYVRGGLETLKAHWGATREPPKGVAFPALGCGLGGLPWQGEGGTGGVLPLLLAFSEALPDVYVELYAPVGAYA